MKYKIFVIKKNVYKLLKKNKNYTFEVKVNYLNVIVKDQPCVILLLLFVHHLKTRANFI